MDKVKNLIKLGKPKDTPENRKAKAFIDRMSNRSSFEAEQIKNSPPLRKVGKS